MSRFDPDLARWVHTDGVYTTPTSDHPRVTWSAARHPTIEIGIDDTGPYLSVAVITHGTDGRKYGSLNLRPSGDESAALLRGVFRSRDGLYAVADWLQDRNGPGAVSPECRSALWYTLRTIEGLCQPVANGFAPALPEFPLPEADQYSPEEISETA